MKIFAKSFIIAVSLLSIITIKGEALSHQTPPNVELEGNAKGIVYIPGDEPFLAGENMAPGDKITRTLEIKNNHNKPYNLYLRAERVTPTETYDLLNVIRLTITYKDETLYDGPVSGEDGMTDNIYLGTFAPGDKEDLLAVAEFDPSISPNNASYWNKSAQVDWIFTAQRTEENTDEDGFVNDQENSNIGGGSNNQVPPNNVGSDSETVTSPNTNSPQTGDTTILPYILLGGLGVVGLYKMRRKND